MKKFVCVDLEMSKLNPSERRLVPSLRYEIIQIGAVLLDENYNVISEFSSYVKPHFSFVNSEIKNLTGISNATLKNAPDFAYVIDKYNDWIGENEVTSFCWSKTDYIQLWNEINAKVRQRKDLFESIKNFVDLQEIFDKQIGSKIAISVESALKFLNLDFQGQVHQANYDAYNTARILHKIFCSKTLHADFEYLNYSNHKNENFKDDSDEYKTSFASFLSPELLEKFGIKNKNSFSDDNNSDKENKVIFDKKNEKLEKEEFDEKLCDISLVKNQKLLELFNMTEIQNLCIKYKLPILSWENFAQKTIETSDMQKSNSF